MGLNSANPVQSAQAIRDVIRGLTAPTAGSGVRGDAGTLYIRLGTPEIYQKQDSGKTTNWKLISDGSGATQITRPAAGALSGADVGRPVCFNPQSGEVELADLINFAALADMRFVGRVRGALQAAAPASGFWDTDAVVTGAFNNIELENDSIGFDGNTFTITSEGMGAPALGTRDIAFTGQPADGDTVAVQNATLGQTETFTFRAAPATDTEILIGASLSDTLDNAAAVINARLGDVDYSAAAFQNNIFGGIPMGNASNQGGTSLRFEVNFIADMAGTVPYLPSAVNAVSFNGTGANVGAGGNVAGEDIYMTIPNFGANELHYQPSPYWMARSIQAMIEFYNANIDSFVEFVSLTAQGGTTMRTDFRNIAGVSTVIDTNMGAASPGIVASNTSMTGGTLGTQLEVSAVLDGAAISGGTTTLIAGVDFATDPDPAVQAANIVAALQAADAAYANSFVAADNSVIGVVGPVGSPDTLANTLSVNVLRGGLNFGVTLVQESAETIDRSGAPADFIESCQPVIGTLVSVSGGNAVVSTFNQIKEIDVTLEPVRAGERLGFVSGEIRSVPQNSQLWALENQNVGNKALVIQAQDEEMDLFSQRRGNYVA